MFPKNVSAFTFWKDYFSCKKTWYIENTEKAHILSTLLSKIQRREIICSVQAGIRTAIRSQINFRIFNFKSSNNIRQTYFKVKIMIKIEKYELLLYLDPVILLILRGIIDYLPASETAKMVTGTILGLSFITVLYYFEKKFTLKYSTKKTEINILNSFIFLYAVILIQCRKYLDTRNIAYIPSVFLQFPCVTPLLIISYFLFRRVKPTN